MRGLVRLALTAGLLLAAARGEGTPAMQAKCKTLTECYPGSKANGACSVKDGACAMSPCVDFAQGLCFAKDSSGKCIFSWVDCSDAFNSGGGGTNSTSASSGSGNHPAGTAGNSTNTHKSGSGSHKNAGEAGSGGGSKSMGGLFAILGGTCGVVAVAVIFIVLIRRTREPSEDEADEMEVTPVGLTKAPNSFSQPPQYAPYAQATPAHPITNPTTPTNRVVQYYKDNAMPSPRVSGKGFGIVQPPPAAPKVVRTAPSANAPTFFSGASNVSSNDGMYSSVTSEVGYAQPVPMAMNELGYAPAPNAVHVGVSAGNVEPMEERRTTGVMVQMHAEHVEIPDDEMEESSQTNYRVESAHRDSFEF